MAMKTIVALILPAALAAAPAPQNPQSRPASVPADAKLTAEEREKAVAMMREAEKETLKAVEGLSDAQWAYKPAPDKWSAGEVVEHLSMAEDLLRARFEVEVAGTPDADWRAKPAASHEQLEKMLLDRTKKFQAPEPARPTGKLTRAEAMKRFQASRAKTVELAQKTTAPVKAFLAKDGPFAGMSAHLMLLVVPMHNRRHNAQIAEVKASAGFPAK